MLCPAADGGLLSRRRPWSTTRSARAWRPASSCVAEMDHPRIRERMEDLKMGEGPYFTFFRPYHLTCLEVPLTCARVVLYGKADMIPMPRPVGRGLRGRQARPRGRRDARSDRRVLLPRLDHDDRRGGRRRGDPLRAADRRQGDRADQEGRADHPRRTPRCRPTAASSRCARGRTRCSPAEARAGARLMPTKTEAARGEGRQPALRHPPLRADRPAGGAEEDVPDPPLRGGRRGQLHARPDPRHDAPLASARRRAPSATCMELRDAD